MNQTEEPVETDDAGRPCGITAIFPNAMSCRGRAESFARRLQSRLRSLGSQDSPTSPTDNENTWLTHNEQENGRSPGVVIQSFQPIRLASILNTVPTNNNDTANTADSYYDFDMEPESPGSPIDDCEYTRLIETTTTTPNDPTGPESGYVCASPCSSTVTRSSTGQLSSQSSQSSSDGAQQYYDPEASDNEHSKSLSQADYFDCMEFRKDAILSNMTPKLNNGHVVAAPVVVEKNNNEYPAKFTSGRAESSDSCSDSLPPSQSMESNCTWTPQQSSNSNSTLQDELAVAEEEPIESKVDEEEKIGVTEVAEEAGEDGETTEIRTSSLPMMCNGHPVTREIKLNFDDDADELATEHSKFVADIGVPNAKVCDETLDHDIDYLTTVVEEADDDLDEFERPPRVQRSSSLKTGKTPPGTPGRKKIVRFADVLGLDLADVRTFLGAEVPKIPKYVYEDLNVLVDDPQSGTNASPHVDRILMPLFQQPSALPDFLDKVRDKQVCLENACVSDPVSMSIIGSVRVRNLDFHKSVYIRYTSDNWRSFSDLQANYVDNSCDGFSDRYAFLLFANSLKAGDRLEMAIRFHCKGQQFWDNNYGANYCFQCLPATTGNVQVMTAVVPIKPVESKEAEPWQVAFY